MIETNAPQFRFILTSGVFGRLLLKHDPIGWDTMGLSVHRDQKYHGIATEYNAETLGFIKEGKQYLEQAKELRGIEADIDLEVQIFQPNDWLWYTYRHYRIDMTAAEETANEFRCGLDNAGLMQKFLNRDDTKVDLFGRETVSNYSSSPVTPLPVEMHSRAIYQRYESFIKDVDVVAAPNFVTDGESRFQTLYFGFGEPTINDFKLESVYGGFFTVPSGVNNPEQPIYVTKEAGEFNIELSILCQLSISRGGNGFGDFDKVEGQIYFRINDEAPQRIYNFQDQNASQYQRLLSTSHRLIRTLAIGDRIYLYGRIHVFDIHEGVFGYRFQLDARFLPGSFLKISAHSTTPPSMANGLLIYEALEKLARDITDEHDCFRSNFFGRTDSADPYPVDGPGSLLFVTGGFQLRGFPLEKKSLFANWKELIDSLCAIYNLGVGVERKPDGQEVIVVEDVTYFYSDEIVLDLTDPQEQYSSLRLPGKGDENSQEAKKVTIAAEHYNAVDIGYQKWRPNQVNGLDEFNTRHEYSLPLTQVKNKYTQLSSYITAGHYIETVRRDRYDITATTDTGSDDEGFLICVLRNPTAPSLFITERNQLALGPIEEIFSPDTVYNLRLSPKRMLLHHALNIAAGLIRRDDKRIKFIFGEGNTLLKSCLMGEDIPVKENVDLRVAPTVVSNDQYAYLNLGIPEPLWLPLQYIFDHPLRHHQMQRILENPRGRVRFRDAKGRACEGWIIDIKHEAAENRASFTLRACARLVGGN
ncbi:hypothetical protein K3G63_21985 [Hymenobacter sp. HSC-4F20]|uniref:hypothetical protein n=1 Tax=Hymenobacter sp. HSC-4F20 TaxID=2864135 RepID=UPI001C73D74D|nr:hypothetical protein [Hymenobacter sp. HSC-4F20]MBX0293131.1 hypothetical protein [Hymenobacter sp. HSC-4F20]